MARGAPVTIRLLLLFDRATWRLQSPREPLVEIHPRARPVGPDLADVSGGGVAVAPAPQASPANAYRARAWPRETVSVWPAGGFLKRSFAVALSEAPALPRTVFIGIGAALWPVVRG